MEGEGKETVRDRGIEQVVFMYLGVCVQWQLKKKRP